ncbi:MAG: glycosyl transferase, partial [gamma proteobacterium symbiont of Stewartia floridana]
TALLANALSGNRTRVAVRSGTTVSKNLASRSRFDRFVQRNSMRYLYRHAETILVPSKGAADDFADYIGIERSRIQVVPSPIITPRFYQRLNQPLDHPWFQAGQPKVILGVGELCRRKDFTTLIRAFDLLKDRYECRLMIVGEGRARERLEAEVKKLGLEQRVSLPGFVDSPYPYMKASALFVLSSLWEGLGAVLVEALAAGTPVASTSCPSGPEELLADLPGEPLAPPGDVDGLAEAMARQLDRPLSAEQLQAAAAPYTLENSVANYLQALGLD